MVPFIPFIHLALVAISALGQTQPPSTAPNPQTPNAPYGPTYQDFFKVTNPLPNVNFDIPSGYAGNIGVNRPGHPNNTLFFWAYESKPGSLTSTNTTAPWVIWLNGGPGSSSLLGLFVENGPVHITTGTTPTQNKFSWHRLADTIWIDQPVGTGWSTADGDAYAADEDQIAADFVGFLSNLVKVFPSLAKRPLYLTGESYAGVYIPYIAKALFSMTSPPVSLKKLAMGDAVIGAYTPASAVPVPWVIQTFPQLIGYNSDIYNYFKTQSHLCGFDISLTYPQTGGLFPTFRTTAASDPASPYHTATPGLTPILWKRGSTSTPASQSNPEKVTRSLGGKIPLKARAQAGVPSPVPAPIGSGHPHPTTTNPLEGRANGTIDPWYGCWIFQEMWDVALNFSLPWVNNPSHSYNVYSAPDALDPDVPLNPTEYINDDRTRAAAHAPLTPWIGQPQFGAYPFGSNTEPYNVPGTNLFGDPSPEPMVFFSELMTNATKNGVKVVLYSGNDDSYISHFGTQITIQNTTFGGIQGFTQKPATPWKDDNGKYAGVVHQERGLVYVLFDAAGHQIPYYSPEHAYVFLREFILGDNPTGTLNGKTVIGGTQSKLGNLVQTANSAIFTGAGKTQGVYVAPSKTIASWQKFIATATVLHH